MADKPEYLLFRRTVRHKEIPEKTVIRVTADSCYILYINGRELLRGPAASGLPVRYTDEVDIAPYLVEGENVLAAAVVHYPGDRHLANTFGAGPSALPSSTRGGFLVDGAQDWQTGEEYRCIPLAAYTFVPVENEELQYIGFTEALDASRYPHGWTSPGFDDSGWGSAVVAADNRPFRMGGLANVWQVEPRPIPLLFEQRVGIKGVARCAPMDRPEAEGMPGEGVTVPPHTDAFIELDAGTYRTAYPDWEIDGGVGAEIRFLYAESYGFLRDGVYVKEKRDDWAREGSFLKGCTDRYLPDGRRRSYTPLHYRAFRFIRLDIRTREQPLRLRLKGLRHTAYPLRVEGRFQSGYPQAERIWEVSLRTLRCCMRDTFIDCPHYERMQYLMDTMLEALYGYAVSRDDRLARKALRDFHDAQLPDGLIPCNAPAKIVQIIPAFTFYWIMMLADHYQYFGDAGLVAAYYPAAEKALAYFTNRLDDRSLLRDTGFWQYVDWTEDWPRGIPTRGPEESNLIYTMMLAYTLRLAAGLGRLIGRGGCAAAYDRLADRITRAVNRYGYDERAGLYSDTAERPQWSQHAQVWAVLSGVADGERSRRILEASLDRQDVTACSFCMQYFLFRALEAAGLYERTRGRWSLWEKLLEQNLTTWPEDPVSCRSDCHAWSAVPLYELMTRGVGLRPAEPGFARVRIAPRMLWLGCCRGSCQTPYGEVSAAWENRDGVLSVTVSTGRPTPVLWELTEGDGREDIVDGTTTMRIPADTAQSAQTRPPSRYCLGV